MHSRSIIIGANSFLGSVLASQLHQEGEEVLGVYHHQTDRLPPQIKTFPVSQLAELPRDVQTVYIVSAYISAGQPDTRTRELLFKTNVDLVDKVCQLFSHSRIVYCSSVSVYALSAERISESSPKEGLNEYGVSKLWGEKIVSGIPNHAIVRFSSLYGPGMNRQTIIPRFTEQAIKDQKISVFGQGARLQNYLHVNDAAGYLRAAGKVPLNGAFLACAKEEISNRQLAEIIASETGAIIETKGEDTSPSFTYDNAFTLRTLTLPNFTNLEDGIKAYVRWTVKEF